MQQKTEIAVFGGGCFWCTEAVFEHLKGVSAVTPGYAGGKTDQPDYQKVSNGNTGHAEVIQIEFDKKLIAYKDLLTVFFATHDPTTLNRQGNDIGTQYRSVILYTSEEQKHEAESFIQELNNSSEYGSPIVTEVKPLDRFYAAEDYHQQYYQKNLAEPYCQIVINPKLRKVKEKFSRLLNTIKK
jgi:peptide-methionine (S)-S-oxide reductase